jgi:uncharacterized Zn finger protein
MRRLSPLEVQMRQLMVLRCRQCGFRGHDSGSVVERDDRTLSLLMTCGYCGTVTRINAEEV